MRATSEPGQEFQPQTLPDFIAKPFPPKEALIEGVLNVRDRISLTGRRRHGKTTLLSNIALAGALGRSEYLGFPIVRPFNTLAFYLEDDGGEMQLKLNRMLRGETSSRVHLYTREDLYDRGIRVGIKDEKFRDLVNKAADLARPDLVIFDNLGHLIGADYNNATAVHELMEFTFRLGGQHNCAVVIAAHPRKASGLNDPLTGVRRTISLVQSPQMFFEEAMGSSHFVNSTGSLWGIERDAKTGKSNVLLGAQRLTGTETITVVEKDDDDWFQRVDDLNLAKAQLMNTPQRRKAWDLLPDEQEFTYAEARAMVVSALRSPGSFHPWFSELKRQGLVVETDGRYRKARSTKVVQ